MGIIICIKDDNGELHDGWIQIETQVIQTKDKIATVELPDGVYKIRPIVQGFRGMSQTLVVPIESSTISLVVTKG